MFLVSAADVMDIGLRFDEATAYNTVSVASLEPHKPYPVIRAETVYKILNVGCVYPKEIRRQRRPGLPTATLQRRRDRSRYSKHQF